MIIIITIAGEGLSHLALNEELGVLYLPSCLFFSFFCISLPSVVAKNSKLMISIMKDARIR